MAYPRSLRRSALRLVLGVAACAPLLAPASVRADVPISDEARAHFAAGVNLLRDPAGPRYEEAYAAFKAAYAVSPSPQILGNLGLCAMNLERDGEAIEAYEKYLAEAKGLDPAERAQTERDLATLRTNAVRVELRFEKPGVTVTDVRTPGQGSAITNRYAPGGTSAVLLVHPGSHVMTFRRDGAPAVAWEFEAVPGAPQQRAVEFPAAAAPPPAPTAPVAPPIEGGTAPDEGGGVPTSVFVAGGATAALAVAGVVTGVLALGKKGDFDDLNDGRHVGEAEDARDGGQTLNVVTDVLLGAAVVGAAVTTVLYVTSSDGSGGTARRRRAAEPAWALDAGWMPGGGAAHVRARF